MVSCSATATKTNPAAAKMQHRKTRTLLIIQRMNKKLSREQILHHPESLVPRLTARRTARRVQLFSQTALEGCPPKEWLPLTCSCTRGRLPRAPQLLRGRSSCPAGAKKLNNYRTAQEPGTLISANTSESGSVCRLIIEMLISCLPTSDEENPPPWFGFFFINGIRRQRR